MKDNKKTNHKGPQQQPEDAEKQNAQQEREFREQQEGKIKNTPRQVPAKESRKEFEEIKKDEKGKKK